MAKLQVKDIVKNLGDRIYVFRFPESAPDSFLQMVHDGHVTSTGNDDDEITKTLSKAIKDFTNASFYKAALISSIDAETPYLQARGNLVDAVKKSIRMDIFQAISRQADNENFVDIAITALEKEVGAEVTKLLGIGR